MFPTWGRLPQTPTHRSVSLGILCIWAPANVLQPHESPASPTSRGRSGPHSAAGPAAALWPCSPFAWLPCCPSAASRSSFSFSPFLQPDGCPDLCNGNGRCTLGQNSWQCVCQTGWRGPGCNVAMETSCADNKDNEGGERASSNSQPLKSRALFIDGHRESFILKDLSSAIVKCCCNISFEASAAENGHPWANGDSWRHGLEALGLDAGFGFSSTHCHRKVAGPWLCLWVTVPARPSRAGSYKQICAGDDSMCSP